MADRTRDEDMQSVGDVSGRVCCRFMKHKANCPGSEILIRTVCLSIAYFIQVRSNSIALTPHIYITREKFVKITISTAKLSQSFNINPLNKPAKLSVVSRRFRDNVSWTELTIKF
jgi:hypothetical protein